MGVSLVVLSLGLGRGAGVYLFWAESGRGIAEIKAVAWAGSKEARSVVWFLWENKLVGGGT